MWHLKQNVVSAFRELRVERFRTLLSLVSVGIGIFSIVAVLTVVDSMRGVIMDSFESFGSNVVMIEQIPLEPDLNEDGFFKWWKYTERPQVSYNEFLELRSDENIDKISFCRYFSGDAAYRDNTFREGEIVGVDGDWLMSCQGEIEYGRGFSNMEMERGDAVVIIGHSVAESLFNDAGGAVGKSISIGCDRAVVIGVFETMGTSDMSLTDLDAVKVVPYHFSKKLDSSGGRSSIVVSPAYGLSKSEFDSFLKSRMRMIRSLESGQDDDFALNKVSFLEDQVTEIFNLVNILGWLVGCFSLLIGGFGIANIMFVAVYERVHNIGIMKALGATRQTIASQFLIEAVILSFAGALIGLTGVGAGVAAANFISGGSLLKISISNITVGIGVSMVIGLVAGVSPALKAASLQPSVAIEGINRV